MMDEPKAYSGSIKGILSGLQIRGVDIEPIMAAAKLSPKDLENEDSYVPLHSAAVIFEETARALDNELFCFDAATTIDPTSLGILGYACSHAPTIRTAINTLSRYLSLIVDFRSLELVEADGLGEWKWSFWKGFGGLRQILDFIPARNVFRLREALGESWSPQFVRLEHSKPKNLAPYIAMFGSHLSFNQPENSIGILSRDLDQAMPLGDENLWKYLTDYADEVVMANARTQDDLAVRVEDAIVKALPAQEATIERISKFVGLGVRTLQRELEAQDTSFSQIFDQARRDLAEKYILSTDLNISQIAFLLGFSEISAFSRASRRWFGNSPRALRQNKHTKK